MEVSTLLRGVGVLQFGPNSSSSCYIINNNISTTTLFYHRYKPKITSIKTTTTITTTRTSITSSIRRTINQTPTKTEPAARDIVIDFGKYKGKMLGTLPSTYLKWVSDNLRARDFQHWANLADQVLADPVYKDRIEWEFVQNLLNGNVLAKSEKGGEKVSESLAEIAERFGWDNDDKLGWSRVDFDLLGTSKGSPIPRTTMGQPNRREESPIKKERKNGNGGEDSNRRLERRERLRMKRSSGGEKKKKSTTTRLRFEGVGDEDDIADDHIHVIVKENPPPVTISTSTCPFPGRESLLNKRRSLHQPPLQR